MKIISILYKTERNHSQTSWSSRILNLYILKTPTADLPISTLDPTSAETISRYTMHSMVKINKNHLQVNRTVTHLHAHDGILYSAMKNH